MHVSGVAETSQLYGHLDKIKMQTGLGELVEQLQQKYSHIAVNT